MIQMQKILQIQYPSELNNTSNTLRSHNIMTKGKETWPTSESESETLILNTISPAALQSIDLVENLEPGNYTDINFGQWS